MVTLLSKFLKKVKNIFLLLTNRSAVFNMVCCRRIHPISNFQCEKSQKTNFKINSCHQINMYQLISKLSTVNCSINNIN